MQQERLAYIITKNPAEMWPKDSLSSVQGKLVSKSLQKVAVSCCETCL